MERFDRVDEFVVRKDSGQVVQAVRRGNIDAANELIGSLANKSEVLLCRSMALVAALDTSSSSEGFISMFFFSLEQKRGRREMGSETSRARDLLVTELQDGRKHSYAAIRAVAQSRGIKIRAVQNAATQLGVRPKDVNTAKHTYCWPASARRAWEATSRR